MTILKKSAGEARERPRPMTQPEAVASAPTHMAKAVGPAPSFDHSAKKLAPRAEAPKGMISNPWVKHWAGSGAAPSAGPSETVAAAKAGAKTRSAAKSARPARK